MKNEINSRPVPDTNQLMFDPGLFQPNKFEDGFVSLLDALLDNKYKVVSAMDFRTDTDTADPLIVCATGDLQIDPGQAGLVSSGFGLNAYPGSIDNRMRYSRILKGPLHVRCVARSAREARTVSYAILEWLTAVEPFVCEMFQINSFRVISVGGTKKIDGETNDYLWVSEILCSYSYELAVSVDRVAPRLKSFNVLGLNP